MTSQNDTEMVERSSSSAIIGNGAMGELDLENKGSHTAHHNWSGTAMANPQDYVLEPVELGALGGANAVLTLEKEFEEAGVPVQNWWNRIFKKKDDKPKEEAKPRVGAKELFRFATRREWMIMAIGVIFAMGSGVSQIVVSIIIGDITTPLVSYNPACDDPVSYEILRQQYPYLPPADQCNLTYLRNGVIGGMIDFAILGAVAFVTNFVQNVTFGYTGEVQAKRIRERYVESLLRQDVGYFDGKATGDLITRLSGDLTLIQEGMSEKVASIVQFSTMFLTGIIVAFVRGWLMSLVILACFPLLMAAGAFLGITISRGTTAAQEAYAKAGDLATQAITNVRTVFAFSGQRREIVKYETELDDALKAGKRNGYASGAGIGSIFLILFAVYSLAFYYGSWLISWGTYDVGQVLNVFFALIFGSFSIAQLAPNMTALGTAQGAAYEIYSTIDRVSPIDPLRDDPTATAWDPNVASNPGKTIAQVSGTIELRNVDFSYPSRPNTQVLKDYNLTIPAGATVALVGASGSSKSTIVKLVERFYDVTGGAVLLDGVDIKELNVHWYRSKIGFVAQEPQLFNRTIRENVSLGLPTTEGMTPEQVQQKVVEACKMANAHDFVSALPQGYETVVGESGALLSGGQKQRIAIARSIISNPPILLLDEATSALDTASERIVQAALEAAAKDRTTILIAHRLSTVKNADLIVVMDQGRIVEQGNHNDLLAKQGAYYSLVQQQSIKTERIRARRASSAGNLPAPTQAVLDNEPLDDLDDIDDEEVEKTFQTLNRAPSTGKVDAKPIIQRTKSQIMADAEAKLKEEEDKYKARPAPWGRLFYLNRTEWPHILLGTIGAAINGCIQPVFSIVFTNITNVLVPSNPNLRAEANFWSAMFLVLGVAQFIGFFLQFSQFTISGEILTRRLRSMYFATLLRQEPGYFDDDANSPGVLTGRLATEATLVKGLAGELLGTLVSLSVTMIAGLTIAFVKAWQVTLVVLCIVPVLVVAGIIQGRLLLGATGASKARYLKAANIASEAVSQIKTVQILGKEKMFLDAYKADIVPAHKAVLKGTLSNALAVGFSQAAFFGAWILAYGACIIFISNGQVSSIAAQNATFAVIFSAIQLGQGSSFAPNIVKAKIAALQIFDLLDRQPAIPDPLTSGGKTAPPAGQWDMNDVEFIYPTRPDQKVLRGISLRGAPGRTVALVGASGSGKSTVIALLERFYDINAGSAKIEGVEIRDWDLNVMRSEMALVQQEPILFSGSIYDNIAYGKPENLPPATMEEVEAAAAQANCLGFVKALPQGFNTPVGEKGALLSGGQKQRVAIARALIRQPKILLLDEATSALDSESEKVVQTALDNAAKGRTTVTIAHRLSTIQDADWIYVFQRGVVVEEGKHFDLIAKNGLYAELVAQQQLGAH